MLAIIGGTGLYQFEALQDPHSFDISTPYGSPSASITQGLLAGRPVLFLPRHGLGHSLLPSEVNYRANIYALKKLGATAVVGVSAVGSLRQEIAPGDFILPDQYLDFTKRHRPNTFFGEGIVAHISTAEPTCRKLASDINQILTEAGHRVHERGTYACVEGPRLGNKAESHMMRQLGCHLVGMTNVPEVYLAREAQLRYITIAIATDYDCWLEDPAQHVSVEQVFPLYKAGVEKIKAILPTLAQSYSAETDAPARHALRGAVLTPVSQLSEAKRDLLSLLQV